MTLSIPIKRYLFQGEELSIYQVARRTNINAESLRARVERGLTMEQAVAAKPMTAAQAGRKAKKKSPWRNGIK